MTRYLTFLLTISLSTFVLAQNTVTSYQLGLNQVNATVNDGGVFFNDGQVGFAGYEVPSGSQLHPIYAMGFWFGGVDLNGQLKLSAQRYQNLKDQFKGPLTIDGSATAPPSGTWIDAIFPVTRAEIDAHIANFMNTGYVVPQNISNWPAHGDVSFGQDYYLAPFVDTDNNGSYDPASGDYPCIRGDNAAFVIMNDKRAVHLSGGDPIGIEMHYMFYEYVGIPEIENTTFVNLKLINRGTQKLNDFKVSVFLDADIGNYADDYFGSDSTRNMIYFYNGDFFDQAGMYTAGYGDVPPAAGLVALNADFQSIGAFSTIANTAAEFWNLMNAMYVSGAPWTNAATGSSTSFMFASDPSSSVDTDSEVAQATIPGDRRGVANINLGTINPSDEFVFDFAVIYHRDTISNVDNASGLLEVADIVQNYFDSSISGECNFSTVSIPENSMANYSVFPNPAQGKFTISFQSDFSKAQVEIRDLSGRVVLEPFNLSSKKTTIKLNQPSGVYFLQMMIDGHSTMKRIIIE